MHRGAWRGPGEESPAAGGDGPRGHGDHAEPQGSPGPQEPDEPWEGSVSTLYVNPLFLMQMQRGGII